MDSRGGNSFFFQAEDGIRDLTVTGVQTCALPISLYLTSMNCSKPSDSISFCRIAFLPSAVKVISLSAPSMRRSEEHTSELQSQSNLVCRLLLEKKKKNT